MFGRFKRIAGVFVVVGLCGTLAACGSPEPITTAAAPLTAVTMPATTAEPTTLPIAEPIAEPTAEPTVEPIAAEPTPEATAAPVPAPAVAGGPVQPAGGECPAAAPIKGNRDSMIYHVPGGGSYSRTRPEDCFASAADAEAAGYRRAKR